LASCFIRINYRNANGKEDFYLVDDMAIDGDNITFSWLLSPRVTEYKGQVKFVMCAVGPDLKLKWHTTQGTGQVLDGLEPDNSHVESQTADVVAQLIAMVEEQTTAVENTGVEQIASVRSATEIARTAAVNEIEAKRANSLASIPSDYTALSGTVESLVRGRGNAIVCEVEGTTIAVDDASDMAIQGMRIFGKSTQDGVPTPEAPVEIKSVDKPVVSVCGKNLLKVPDTINPTRGLSFTVNADRSITVNGAPAEILAIGIYGSYSVPIPFPSGNYILSGGVDINRYIRVRIHHADGTLKTMRYSQGEHQEFTIEDGELISITLYFANLDQNNNVTFYPMVRLASVADERYEPYQGATVNVSITLPGIPVTSGGNYTDESGQQWICDEVDLERGVYVQRIGRYIVEPEKLFTLSSYSTQNFNAFYHHVETLAVSFNAPAYVTHLPFTPNDAWGDHLHFSAGLNNSALYYFVPKTQFPDVETWRDFVADQYNRGTPITTMYILATPIETPLSEAEIAAYRTLHSNYPNTTVLNNAGAHMVVKYAADTKLYIDKKIKEALQ
jgi:hypothetical protein